LALPHNKMRSGVRPDAQATALGVTRSGNRSQSGYMPPLDHLSDRTEAAFRRRQVKPVRLRSQFMLLNMITLSSEQSWASKIISQYLRNAKSIWVWEEPCVSRSVHRLNLLMSATHKRLFIGSYNKLIGRLTNSCWKELYLEFKIKWHEMSFYEQEVARKGRSSRSLRKEEPLPPLPRKKKASSKGKKKAAAAKRRYMSEFGHIVEPAAEMQSDISHSWEIETSEIANLRTFVNERVSARRNIPRPSTPVEENNNGPTIVVREETQAEREARKLADPVPYDPDKWRYHDTIKPLMADSSFIRKEVDISGLTPEGYGAISHAFFDDKEGVFDDTIDYIIFE